jgi:hypothetical protein
MEINVCVPSLTRNPILALASEGRVPVYGESYRGDTKQPHSAEHLIREGLQEVGRP